MKLPSVAPGERAFLRFLAFTVNNVSPVYYFQALSLWVRIKDSVPFHHKNVVIAMCFNISVHFFGPQSLCRGVRVFSPPSTLFQKYQLQDLSKTLLGYSPATHLHTWQLARNIQWFIVLRLLQGRVQ